MPLAIECDLCGKKYRVPERFAGKKVACEKCGGEIRVPRGDDDDDDGYREEPRRPAARSARRPGRKKSSMAPLLIGFGIVGALGLIGIVAVGAMMLGSRRAQPVAQTGLPAGQTPAAGTIPQGNQAPQGNTPPVQAVPVTPVRNAEYEKNLARQALQRAQQAIVTKYSSPKMAIVVINGVQGGEAEADYYLERKLFKAAYFDYEAGQARAQQLTEANKKAALDKAIAEEQAKWGGRGPSMVWYRYQPVNSDVPYPEVKGGAATNGQYVYYVGPALDLNQLGSRIGVGQVASVDSNSRTVTINASLPVPIPDIDLEELQIQHGREAVVTLEVSNADGEASRVSYFLEKEARALGGPDTTLTLVGPRQIKPGVFRMYLGPVKNLNDFTGRISFGSISQLDPSSMTVEVTASLPEDLPPRPTAAELAEIERKRREGDRNPKDGESELDWAIRVLKKGESDLTTLERVLTKLAQLEVEEKRQDDVAIALIAGLGGSWVWHRSDYYLRAMEVWYCKRLEKHIGQMLAEQSPKLDKKKLLSVLASHPSEDSAKLVAPFMGDFFFGKEAAFTLREMGAVAEDAVLKFISDPETRRRTEAYLILADIGTKKSLSKLKANLAKERDKQIKEGLKDVIGQILTRHKDSESTAEDDAK